MAAEDDFVFRNDPKDFEDTRHKMTAGYCWGHAVGTQNFSRLAVFSNEAKLIDSQGRILPEGSAAYEKEIKRRIKKVLKNKVAEFPGIRNLSELSSTSPYDKFLKEQIAKTWANKAMSFNGIDAATNSKVDKKTVVDKRLAKIKDRIDKGLSSQLVFTAEGWMGFTHAVMVRNYFVDEVSGDTVLCIQDSNVEVHKNANCQNQMRFSLNKNKNKNTNEYQITYNDWKFLSGGAIGGINLNGDEDYDLLRQIKSLRSYCLQSLCPSSLEDKKSN